MALFSQFLLRLSKQLCMQATSGESILSPKLMVVDWAVCFSEFVNASRRYKDPKVLPSDVRGHSSSPESIQGLRVVSWINTSTPRA